MKKNYIIRIIILTGALAIGTVTGCPWYQIFGIPCPCCGITRAWISFFKGEFSAAFSYHPLFVPITGVLLIFVFADKIFKKQKTKNMVFILSGGIIFLSYLVRLWQGSIFF